MKKALAACVGWVSTLCKGERRKRGSTNAGTESLSVDPEASHQHVEEETLVEVHQDTIHDEIPEPVHEAAPISIKQPEATKKNEGISPDSLPLEEPYEHYEYSPLNEEAQEIRLLTLLPSTFTSEIRVCLHITPLTESHIPEFEAVSYAWASTENLVKVLIGESGRKTLAVTQNLAEALPYLRHIDQPRVLWIDAICVDQQNLEERGHQVKRMAALYSKAAQVLVWLGPQSDDSPIAIDVIEGIATHVKLDEVTNLPVATSDQGFWADQTIPSTLTNAELLAIDAFIHRPWFQRLWIWQEVMLAQGAILVICGSRIFSWTDLLVAVACIKVKGIQGIPEFDNAGFNERMRHVLDLFMATWAKTHYPIDVLIERSRHSLCTDPRDKIYALLSLLKNASGIEPDYSKSVYEVYQQAVLSLMEHSKNLDVLTTVGSHEHLEGVPSWVPNWVEPLPYRSIGLSFTSHWTVLKLPLDRSGNVLKLEGAIISVIHEVIPIIGFNGPYINKEVVRDLRAIATRAGFRGASHQNPQHEIFTRTLLTNTFAHRCSPPHPGFPIAEIAESVVRRILTSGIDDEDWEEDYFVRTLSFMRGHCQGRSFYVGESGVCGLTATGTKQGDIVVVLLGCVTPMIFRPTTEGRYRVVGQAYCDGFIQGEALLGPLPEHFEAVVRYYPRSGRQRWAYLNKTTGIFQTEDPRLGPLPPGWSITSHDEEEYAELFLNEETGEETDDDPRFTSDALRKRGVPLRVFELV